MPIRLIEGSQGQKKLIPLFACSRLHKLFIGKSESEKVRERERESEIVRARARERESSSSWSICAFCPGGVWFFIWQLQQQQEKLFNVLFVLLKVGLFD